MQDAEAAIRAAEEKTAQDEADRQKRIKDSFDAQMPDEISQKVQAALQKEMVRRFFVLLGVFALSACTLQIACCRSDCKS